VILKLFIVYSIVFCVLQIIKGFVQAWEEDVWTRRYRKMIIKGD
jgi:hypothetical protein